MRKLVLAISLLLLPDATFATTWYVHRDVSNQIVFAGQYVQPGYADEALDDQTSVELQQWFAKVNAPPVPQSVHNWQGHAILVQRGIYDQVVAALAAIPDPTQQQMAQIAFASADFTRNSPLLISILKAPPINYTDAQIDQLFIDASNLAM